MKKIFFLPIFIFFSFSILTAQQTITETERLASLGKIYGFLKYYHPTVGKGEYNWDKEFIKYLPEVIKATDKESLSKIYNDWIHRLGNIENCKNCNSNEHSFDKNFDLSWTQDPNLFNKKLAAKLKFLENNRIQGDNFYVTTKQPVGNIQVTNEPVYQNFEYPSEEYRLLGLFKYWNIIEYFYPYKYLTDQDWDAVLLEMIPKIRTAPNKEQYQSTVKELIAKLDDSHVWIHFKNERPKYLPVKISNIDDKPVVSGFYNDSIADLNGLKLGDVLLRIDNKDIKTEIGEKSKYVSGSNPNIKIRNTYYTMLMGTDSIATLTIARNNQIQDLQVNRYDFEEFNYRNNPKSIKSKSINHKIGYINMASVKGGDISDIFKSFENKKAIIIDLRNYPAFIYKLFSRYLNSERRDFCKVYIPNIGYPGKFTYQENLQTSKSNKAFKGKVILLVNHETLSRSEFTAMAFQTADKVITVGNKTAGADGNVVGFEYLGGFKTAISGTGILYPDGSETQRKGIKIDVEVKPTINGLTQGRDEVLEKAIELASE